MMLVTGSMRRCLLALTSPLLFLVGCDSTPTTVEAPPPVVTISKPIERRVVDHDVYTGRTEAVDQVDIRARVSGWLDKVAFKAGDEVKKGQLLFQIDPRPYKATLEAAEAEVERWSAKLALADIEFKRYEKLLEKRAASKEDYDVSLVAKTEADAALRAAKAEVSQAKLDLEFTGVTAPVAGIISREYVTQGNLINAAGKESTLLTTIVSVDPMYAYFDVDERSLLAYLRMMEEDGARERRGEDDNYPVFLALADEENFPHRGYIDFIDNRVNPSTGTIRVRGVFPNKNGFLKPGLFVRIQLPVGRPHESLLVPERALGSQQGQRYVYVVDDKNEVVFRPVQIGQHVGTLRVIEKGLKAGEWVIVNGLLRVRPGVKVDAKKEEITEEVPDVVSFSENQSQPANSPPSDDAKPSDEASTASKATSASTPSDPDAKEPKSSSSADAGATEKTTKAPAQQ
ncbi:Multidrug resistance protein MdtE precursor [Planctomycetes bacterium Pan216]|uniref:Multidrug resistance protein MdtE n=1 Tax=Kolteria novifilia TaxID=2527975 RepID=A0A518B630_9BACT|nr:Multidrug resistance protein MdtE precursor [Planctomycetes bacterium Pan216]